MDNETTSAYAVEANESSDIDDASSNGDMTDRREDESTGTSSDPASDNEEDGAASNADGAGAAGFAGFGLPVIPVPDLGGGGQSSESSSSSESGDRFNGMTRDEVIAEKLKSIEDQYNSGIATFAFVEGYVPWKTNLFEISGLAENGVMKDDGVTPMDLEQWLVDAQDNSPGGYHVDNTGVRATKFPYYDGVHFDKVTIYDESSSKNGVEVVRVGILRADDLPPDENGEYVDVYYYMTQKHVDSGQSNGSGSHTGEVSAVLMLNENEKFQINYAINEYNLDYDITLDGTSVMNDPVDPSAENPVTWSQSIFGGQNPLTTTGGMASFGVTIPYGYKAEVLLYRDGIEGYTDLTGPRKDIVDEDLRSAKVVNEGFPLGTEPVYARDGDSVVTTSYGPSVYRTSAIFYSDLLTEDCRIVVELTTRSNDDNPLVFNASEWINTGYASGRGAMGEDKGWQGSSGGTGNIENFDNSWTWEKQKGTFNITDTDHDGVTDFTWTFQTNTGRDAPFMLDSFALNGVYLSIPFLSTATFGDFGSEQGLKKLSKDTTKEDAAEALGSISDREKIEFGSMTTTVLPDGANVTLEYVRIWGSETPQRVYTLKVTGAQSNVVVTGGNLMMVEKGAPELIPTALVGVTSGDSNEATLQIYSSDGQWSTFELSQPVVKEKNINFEPDTNGFHVRFKLADGYENPIYRILAPRNGNQEIASSEKNEIKNFEDLENGKAPDNATIYYNPVDDYYYLRLDKTPDFGETKIISLRINASAMQYMVRYMVGKYNPDVDIFANVPDDDAVEGMPSYSLDNSNWDEEVAGGVAGEHLDRYDDNGGAFYNVQTTPVISVSDAIPTVKDKTKTFQHWVLVDINENPVKDDSGKPIVINSNGTIDLPALADNGIQLNNEIGGTETNYYVLRLKAVWIDNPEDFHFFIRMVWEDLNGKSELMSFYQDVTTTSTDADNGRLNVAVNTVTDKFKNWFKQHPYYSYASRNTIPTDQRTGNPGETHEDDDGIWEAYPKDMDFTFSEFVKEEARYRVVSNNNNSETSVHYEVENGGTIIIYVKMDAANLPVAKRIVGDDAGANEFTYTATAKLFPEDIARSDLEVTDPDYLSEHDLKLQLPSGTYFSWTPDVTYKDLRTFDGISSDLSFVRYAPEGTDPSKWYSTATFTLMGNEATVLSIPRGNYTVTEDTTGLSYDIEVDGSPQSSADRVVKVVESKADPVIFTNTAQPVSYGLNVKKMIVDDNGNKIADHDDGFDFRMRLIGGDGEHVSFPSDPISVQTSAGEGSSGFSGITFDHTGIFEFIVSEAFDYDTTEYLPLTSSHTVTFSVVNDDGQLAIDKVVVDGTAYDRSQANDAYVEFKNQWIDKENNTLAIPHVYKDLLGRASLPAGMFEFQLSLISPRPDNGDSDAGIEMPAENKAFNGNGADGAVAFQPVKFTEPGTYVLNVGEVVPTNDSEKKSGIEYYSGPGITITYEVTRSEDGSLSVSAPQYDNGAGGNDNTIENQAYASGSFNVYKYYELAKRVGGKWNGDHFDFTATLLSAPNDGAYEAYQTYMSAVDGSEAKTRDRIAIGESATIRIDGDSPKDGGGGRYSTGVFNFDFYGEGEYAFEVREENGGLPGISYDNSVFIVTFNVRAEGEELVAEPSITRFGEAIEGDTTTFNNTYDPERVSVNVGAFKTFENGRLAGKDFTFELYSTNDRFDDDDNRGRGLQTYNERTGEVNFTLEGMEPGTYHYKLYEVNDEANGIEYDAAVYHVEISVSNDADANAPVATVTYMDADGKKLPEGTIPSFHNKQMSVAYADVPSFTKILDGADLQEGQFGFELSLDSVSDGAGERGIILPTGLIASNTADAMNNVIFGDVTFTQPGTYVLKVHELLPEGADSSNGYIVDGIVYDASEYLITYVVKETADRELYAEDASFTKISADSSDRKDVSEDELVFENAYDEAGGFYDLTIRHEIADGDYEAFNYRVDFSNSSLMQIMLLAASIQTEYPTSDSFSIAGNGAAVTIHNVPRGVNFTAKYDKGENSDEFQTGYTVAHGGAAVANGTMSEADGISGLSRTMPANDVEITFKHEPVKHTPDEPEKDDPKEEDPNKEDPKKDTPADDGKKKDDGENPVSNIGDGSNTSGNNRSSGDGAGMGKTGDSLPLALLLIFAAAASVVIIALVAQRRNIDKS